MTKTLMVQGTTSDAGKTVLVAGLCRLLAKQGASVAPFKPQNMALNSAVTADGGEIGRAQALQAEACYLPPHTDMNPILLKPTSDIGAQVIVHGKAISHLDACAYHDYKKVAMTAVLESHQRLCQQYDYVVVEGAGSPAEINLRANDIANMGFAEAVDCPVILVADIDRGGVFAHLVGTLELLSESERKRVVGFVINKFRGDIALLQSGLDWLEAYTHKPVIGVVPYLQGLYLDAEDAINTEQVLNKEQAHLTIVVPVFSRISNHTDFDSLRLHPQVNLQFIGPDMAIPSADVIILPGSKNVRQDLQWLRDNGWQTAIHQHLRYGGKLVGICGGYQMLGAFINDPNGVEGAPGCSTGLGLLKLSTCLQGNKQLRQRRGVLFTGDVVEGYEIHCGVTSPIDTPAESSANKSIRTDVPYQHCLEYDDGTKDGAISSDNQILGSYLHGLFDKPASLSALLNWAGLSNVQPIDSHQRREQDLDRLALTIEQSLNTHIIFPDLYPSPQTDQQ